jgi:hypothetical protein
MSFDPYLINDDTDEEATRYVRFQINRRVTGRREQGVIPTPLRICRERNDMVYDVQYHSELVETEMSSTYGELFELAKLEPEWE